MAQINQELLKKLQSELRLKRAQVYNKIEDVIIETGLERHLAALELARRHHINWTKYATPEERNILRGDTSRQHTPVAHPPAVAGPVKRIIKPADLVVLDLNFISNGELRNILLKDIAELNVAKSQDLKTTAKTCMVFAGSIVEALLLDCLQQKEPAAQAYAATLLRRPNANIERWKLENMVEVAKGIGLLGDDATAGANQMREWRNLIHPARALREAANHKIKPTPGRALLAISFLQVVAEELGTNCRTP